MVDERIAERRRGVRQERQQSRLKRTVAALVLLALLIVAWLIERSSLVALQEVHVEGVERLEAREVLDAADLELGTSTLRLRLRAAEERVARLPLVASVDARRADPLTVVIAVVEREPVVTAVKGRKRVLVDASGLVIDRGRSPGTMVVRMPGRAALPEPGERVATSPPLADAHAIFVQLSGPLRGRIDHLIARGARDVVLVLDSGVRVRMGGPDRLDEKVRSLGAVLEDLGDTRVAVIDVRAPGSPAVRR
jgi:cell division protein FtsQ